MANVKHAKHAPKQQAVNELGQDTEIGEFPLIARVFGILCLIGGVFSAVAVFLVMIMTI